MLLFTIQIVTTMMAILAVNRGFYKMLNDDKLLSQFTRDHSLAQNSNDHKCHRGSPMVGNTRKKTLKDATIKVYPTMWYDHRLCRNQLNDQKKIHFSHSLIL